MPDFAVDDANFTTLVTKVTAASSSATEMAPAEPDASAVCEDFRQQVTDFAETWEEESAACGRYLESFRVALEHVRSSVGDLDVTMAGSTKMGAS